MLVLLVGVQIGTCSCCHGHLQQNSGVCFTLVELFSVCIALFCDYRIVLLVVVYSCRQADRVSEMMCVSARLLSAVHREARVDACVQLLVIAGRL